MWEHNKQRGRFPKSILTPDEKKSLLLLALQNMNGNVSESIKVAGISRRTYYNWLEADEEFAFEVKCVQLDVSEEMLDQAEGTIRFWLGRMDKQTAQWFLKQLGKKRGYGTKVEVEHTGDAFQGLEYPEELVDIDQWEGQSTGTVSVE